MTLRRFRLGAPFAQKNRDLKDSHRVAGLNGRDRDIPKEEDTNRWKQPRLLLIIVCSVCAAVQGMGISIRSRLTAFLPPQC
jgi:hypothetical protein